MYVTLDGDRSWLQVLEADANPTNPVNKQVLLEVDTGEWFVYHEADGNWWNQTNPGTTR